jgi:hypothetical protein
MRSAAFVVGDWLVYAEGKCGIGFKVTFDRGASPTKLKVACRISKTFSDEIESEVVDPRQPELL